VQALTALEQTVVKTLATVVAWLVALLLTIRLYQLW
jgi:hypothetical protein